LAGLTAFEVLDLPEKEARDDATKITGVLRWLEGNPTWLMILDNVDDSAAVAEVAKLMPRLKGGHVVVTARASNFPAFVRKLEVATLEEDAAAQFLFDRTEARARTIGRLPVAWRGNSAALRWGWNRPAHISRPIASASRAI
jgi:hypothetical protein